MRLAIVAVCACAAVASAPTVLPVVQVDLDAPAQDRWTHIAVNYKDKVPAIMDYLGSVIPKWAIPIVEIIAGDILPYFSEYGDEMIGLASAMGMKNGDVVAMNLVYQLEHLGLNCSNWNNTGPTVKDDPGCMAVDPEQEWCYCKEESEHINEEGVLLSPFSRAKYPGMCTSVVAQAPGGDIWHGRNLDWNLPAVLRELAVDVDFMKGGKKLYRGTTLVGFVGLLNGMRSGAYSVSINARGKGGKIFENLIEALKHRDAMTPSQHIRKVLESEAMFSTAISAFATGAMIDEMYFTVAGSKAGEGVVISRDRENDAAHKADMWFLNDTAVDADGWFRLQTNYDHWNPVPVADDRRTPGVASMKAMTQAKIGNETMMQIMTTVPVFNPHTDYTGIFVPATDSYQSGVWMDQGYFPL